jgi:hypothetical protein
MPWLPRAWTRLLRHGSRSSFPQCSIKARARTHGHVHAIRGSRQFRLPRPSRRFVAVDHQPSDLHATERAGGRICAHWHRVRCRWHGIRVMCKVPSSAGQVRVAFQARAGRRGAGAGRGGAAALPRTGLPSSAVCTAAADSDRLTPMSGDRPRLCRACSPRSEYLG